MTTISNLSDDLIGEILSRIPITSLSILRSTCKRWNYLSKTHVFGKKAAARRNQQFVGFMLIDYNVCSLRFSFQLGIDDEIFVDSSVKKIKIRELEEDVVVSQVYQYDGLLLCVANYHSCLVWNPYLGQTQWIKLSRNTAPKYNSYALGYEDNKNNVRNHKILRFIYDDLREEKPEVYNFSSNAWRVIDDDIDTDSKKPNYNTRVSLKGNTYFLDDIDQHHLLCFDFTQEKFGTSLPLPCKPLSPYPENTMTLSCVRDEKLVVLLYNHYNTLETIKIWISTKIEANEISWSMFFKVDRNILPYDFKNYIGRSIRFFIDEENKIALLFPTKAYQKSDKKASIIGEDRFISYVNIGEALNNYWDYSNLVRSYVPSLVQLNVHQQETED